jgi:hypothetical protein
VSETCSRHAGGEKFLEGFGGRPEVKRPLRGLTRRWEDNINIDLRKTGIDGENSIRLAQHGVQWRVFVNKVMNLRVP